VRSVTAPTPPIHGNNHVRFFLWFQRSSVPRSRPQWIPLRRKHWDNHCLRVSDLVGQGIDLRRLVATGSGSRRRGRLPRLLSPRELAFGLAGELYVTDFGNNRVRMIDANGTITTIAGDGDGSFSGDGGPATTPVLVGPRVSPRGRKREHLHRRKQSYPKVERCRIRKCCRSTHTSERGQWIRPQSTLQPVDSSQVDPASVTLSALDPHDFLARWRGCFIRRAAHRHDDIYVCPTQV
jgi:hypothetical protein